MRHEDRIKPFLEAAQAGDESSVLAHLNQGLEVNARKRNGLTALHYAAKHGHPNLAVLLLAHGANVDAASGRKRTPLHEAAMAGHKALCDVLLRAGADVHAKGFKMETPLFLAASHRHGDVCQSLLQAGADVLQEDPRSSSVKVALDKGWMDLALLFLEALDDLEARFHREETMLHKAVKVGFDALVNVLIERGCDVHAQDATGLTALHWACRRGDIPTVEKLLKAGAHADALDGLDRTPLHDAAKSYNARVGLFECLVQHGCPWDRPDLEGVRPLHTAASMGHLNITRFLVRMKADLESRDHQGLTPLMCALNQGKASVAKLLIESGALCDPILEDKAQNKGLTDVASDIQRSFSRRLKQEHKLQSTIEKLEGNVAHLKAQVSKLPSLIQDQNDDESNVLNHHHTELKSH